MRLRRLVGVNPDGSPILEDRSLEESARIIEDNAPVPAKAMRALITVLIAKNVITREDLEKADAR
jgi:hypothetical protein